MSIAEERGHKSETDKDKRETEFYKAQYVEGFVQKWDDLIDWDARSDSEGDFFVRILKERGAKRVLDVATGTGYHSVQLLRAGFEVISADGSANMLSKAFENGRRNGFVLRTLNADWRWLSRDVHMKFDAVVCLGNSFTHLFTERDRRKALAEFYSVLKHDGVLIIDQRNYDAILDVGFDCKHTFYYCGDNIKAEPEHVDDGLARFQYSFPDGSVYHLNMFPIRRERLKNLMEEVGFQQVNTYGDFKQTYHAEEPDFFVHVAEKLYAEENKTQKMKEDRYEENVETAREYYNSSDADNFYYNIWGGEDIHIGLYNDPKEDISAASRRTVEQMASKIDELNAHKEVLDIGSGYAGSARYLAKTFHCSVACLNLSETQNERARQMNTDQGLAMMVNVVDGSFDDIPRPAETVDVVWCQDSILHSADRKKVFQEVDRVLKPGGQFIFTDPMAAENADTEKLKPILNRIKLPSMGSVKKYQEFAKELGWEQIGWTDLTPNLPLHYQRVHDEIEANYDYLLRHCTADYLKNMKIGLQHWVNGGNDGLLQWGILHFRKP